MLADQKVKRRRALLEPICEELQNKLRKKVKLITQKIKEIKNKNFFSEH